MNMTIQTSISITLHGQQDSLTNSYRIRATGTLLNIRRT
ncbi:unnamed protein product [Penicillium roqueforti FM164]|uniref:Uncharacterized protein n=1 Tax=Penicillium roqueforti (strain FM164) TaxID=1365484 RepID=W6QIU4_PENRF|nr:unnamed protein product [Penicillium roqueforti FM164]